MTPSVRRWVRETPDVFAGRCVAVFALASFAAACGTDADDSAGVSVAPAATETSSATTAPEALETDRWIRRPSLDGRLLAETVPVGEHLVAVAPFEARQGGGFDVTPTMVLDPVTGEVREAEPPPVEFSLGGSRTMAARSGQLFVHGFDCPPNTVGSSPSCERPGQLVSLRYDPAGDTWDDVPPPPVSQSNDVTGSIGGFFVAGSSRGPLVFASTEEASRAGPPIEPLVISGLAHLDGGRWQPMPSPAETVDADLVCSTADEVWVIDGASLVSAFEETRARGHEGTLDELPLRLLHARPGADWEAEMVVLPGPVQSLELTTLELRCGDGTVSITSPGVPGGILRPVGGGTWERLPADAVAIDALPVGDDVLIAAAPVEDAYGARPETLRRIGVDGIVAEIPVPPSRDHLRLLVVGDVLVDLNRPAAAIRLPSA